MLCSTKWLREFVPFDGTAQALGDKLTMLGLELEDIRAPFDGLKSILVGHVIECGPHPEADKLSVCRVDVGTELLDIVCGAPNVAQGQKVPVAPVGATLPGGLQIKKAKLRGQASNGMICSERELGLSDAHSGILVLPADFATGARLIDALDLDGEVLEISVTPNRADCLSILGLAREAALAFKLPLRLPEVSFAEKGEDATTLVRVSLSDGELCPLYQGRVLEGARIAPSPLRLRCRLHAHGVRAVSNIVDATNYVLLEWGQPLHAFDLDKVEGGVIGVRPAKAGERLLTLDGQDRLLAEGDLLIHDAVKAVGLAGVMGGINSEITDATRRIFLESAVFRPASIRRTARRLGIQSEASYRFERGVDQQANTPAMHRACALMAELSGARVLPGVCRAEPRPWSAPCIRLRPQKAEKLLGLSPALGFDEAFCRATLKALDCRMEEGSDSWTVMPPSHRLDITREADVIEELGRVYGLDNIPPELPRVERSLDAPAGSEFGFWRRVKDWACGVGLNEAVNYSFVGHADLDLLSLSAENRIAITNPLSADQNVLRNALAPGLLQNLRHNLAQGNMGLRLFELAHIFTADTSSETTAAEYGRLGILLHGPRFDRAWPYAAEDADYSDLKGLVEHLCAAFHLPRPRCVMAEARAYLFPCVRVTVEDRELGVMGRVLPELADRFHARKPVWLAELDLDLLRTMHSAVCVRFAPLPVYPPVRRDITVIGGSLTADAVLEHIASLRLPRLEDAQLIDVFEQEDCVDRNLTFRLTFRDASRTLKDAEVDKEREKVAVSLRRTFGVRI